MADTKLLKDLSVTAELCGAELSEPAARLFVEELQHFDRQAVAKALARCRRELTGRLTLGAVLSRLDDGRPGAEEAWAMFPKSEDDTAVMTMEMQKAMSVALPLLAEGDKIGARMAFLERYRRAVDEARAERQPVNWWVSLGHDASGRAAVLADAVRAGRLQLGYAQAQDYRVLEQFSPAEQLRLTQRDSVRLPPPRTPPQLTDGRKPS
jgi:hypothetical protein